MNKIIVCQLSTTVQSCIKLITILKHFIVLIPMKIIVTLSQI